MITALIVKALDLRLRNPPRSSVMISRLSLAVPSPSVQALQPVDMGLVDHGPYA